MAAALGFGAASPLFAGSKGGLYGWEQVRRYPEVILVEGLFDYAVLWQAGFKTSPARWETISTRTSFQLCDARRTVYLTFDADSNGSGQQQRSAFHEISANEA